MTKEKETWTFKAEDIFQDIPGDPNNINMTIPPKIAEKMGWKEGDTLRVLIGDQGTVHIEKVKKDEKE
jgi:AbrB family looped-hinge helix DNA binding protein